MGTMVNSYQLGGNAAEVYGSQKVAAIFQPLAAETINMVDIEPDDESLDIACGTGIVCREIEAAQAEIYRIVGVDLNESMPEVARKIAKNYQSKTEFIKGDANELLFENDIFSLIFCQQRLQYFPDKANALSEMYRVMRPNGRLVLTVWSGASPLFVAIANALEFHLNAELARKSPAPFMFSDINVIRKLVCDARFGNISTGKITMQRQVGRAAEFVPREIMSNPIGPEVEARGPEIMNAIVGSVQNELTRYSFDGYLVVPQETHLITAVKHG